MQTPGRQIQPQSPMIPIGRRMGGGIDRLLQRATEASQQLEKPKITSLGRVISQLDGISGNFREMRKQIRNDIRLKQRFYREEAKILKKDSENLEGINSKVLLGTRQKLAGVTAGVGAAQFAGGNIGGALGSAGIASLLMAPEIIETISGGVVKTLALKGLIGKQNPTAGITQNVRGASRLKNPLLITAALAASLIIPSLAKSQQTGDKRRQEFARKTIGGREIINKPDVTRFRSQLSRFEGILDNMKVDKEKQESRNVIPLEEQQAIDIDKNLPREKTTNQAFDFLDIIRNKNEMKVGKNQWWDFFDVFRNPTKKDGESVDKLEQEVDKENDLISMEINETTKEGDVIKNENVDVAARFVTENQNFFGDEITETIEPNIDLVDALAQLDVGEIKSEITKPKTTTSPGTTNVVDLSQNESTPQSSSGFSGVSAKTSTVFVTTKFNSSGGAVDKFDAASSLRSYGAFS